MKGRLLMGTRVHLLLFLILFLLSNCEKEKVIHRKYPRLDISDTVQQGSYGVEFEGMILTEGDSEIIDKGFVWSANSNPDITVSRVSAGSGGDPRVFTRKGSTDLFENTAYFVRAYARTKDFTVYSREISFTSIFTKSPFELVSIHPNVAMWNDTVTIQGMHFSFLPSKTDVLFGETKAQILSCSDTALRVVVPKVDEIPQLPVTVKIYEELASFDEEFHFIYPIVKDYYPKEGTFLDTITIITSGLPENPVWIQVTFDRNTATVVDYTKNQFKVLVPQQIEIPTSYVSTSLYGFSSTFPQAFMLKPPVINGFVPETIYMPGGTLAIQGANFNPVKTSNKVYLDGISCEILSNSMSELVIQVPREIIEDPSQDQIQGIPVRVEVAGQSNVPIILPLHYTNKWCRKADFPGGQRYNAVSHGYNGKGYFGLGMARNSFIFTDLWEFDPVSDQWIQKASFPVTVRDYSSSFRIDDNIYLCCGTQDMLRAVDGCLNEVWVYNITQDSWTQQTDFPGQKRHSAFAFTVDGKGYLGGGNYGNTRLYDFWEYDPANNLWTQKGEMPHIETGYYMDISTFSDDEYGYILGVYSNTSSRDFWKYDPGTGTWTELSGFPALEESVAGFHIDGYIYAGSFYGEEKGDYNCFKYSVETDTWTSYIQSASEKLIPDAMVINSQGYILGGGGYSYGEPQSVWQFDPLK
ncbi:MAG: IPT/TIG domain-containing protein [Bacteroidales bacterium]|nr:IPT/TIG domain-containing protein [Bacteroidales bacterium]